MENKDSKTDKTAKKKMENKDSKTDKTAKKKMENKDSKTDKTAKKKMALIDTKAQFLTVCFRVADIEALNKQGITDLTPVKATAGEIRNAIREYLKLPKPERSSILKYSEDMIDWLVENEYLKKPDEDKKLTNGKIDKAFTKASAEALKGKVDIPQELIDEL